MLARHIHGLKQDQRGLAADNREAATVAHSHLLPVLKALVLEANPLPVKISLNSAATAKLAAPNRTPILSEMLMHDPAKGEEKQVIVF